MDLNLLVLPLSHPLPPATALRLRAIPKEGHFARVETWRIMRGSPDKHGGIRFMQNAQWRQKGCDFRVELPQKGKFFRLPVLPIPVQMLQTEKPVQLSVCCQAEQPTRRLDERANAGKACRDRIHQHQQVNFLADCVELSSHFIGSQPSIAKASQQIRAFRLDATDDLKMFCRHLLQGRQDTQVIQPVWVKRVKRLIVSQSLREREAEESIARPIAMKKEEGPLCSSCLDGCDAFVPLGRLKCV